MAQQPNQPRQRAWIIPSELANPLRVGELARDFKAGQIVGKNANVTMNLNGSPLGINIKGEVDEALNDLESLAEQRFIGVNFQAQHPALNNLSVTFNLNVPLEHLTINVQNGTNEQAETIFEYIQARFPRSPGPTEDEASQLTLRLVSLAAEAEKAANAAVTAEQYQREIAKRLEEAEQSTKKANEQLQAINTIVSELSQKQQEAVKNSAEISNLKAQISADAEAARGGKENIGSIEPKIRQFFEEIENNKKSLTEQQASSQELIKSTKDATDSIITHNQKLQEEIKEHLQKAVGASLFSAFQKRKEQISSSKWIWAVLTALAIVAQVVIFIWLAQAAVDGNPEQAFYQRPSFLLRSIASIPIIFFIGYAIRQYSREREYEELYSFKAALSFSLSPYLDLVESLASNKDAEAYRDFVVKTIGQIFENPHQHEGSSERKARKDDVLAKDLLDRLIDFVEKAKK
jgi:predicted  nucleic acid-binding Zn-ribbon protein